MYLIGVKKDDMDIKLLSPSCWSDYELMIVVLLRNGTFRALRDWPGRSLQAIWNKSLPNVEWQQRADAYFKKDKKSRGPGRMVCKPKMPQQWFVNYRYGEMNLRMRLGLTSFKHVGIFPEQAENWNFIFDQVKRIGSEAKVLNLFALHRGCYSWRGKSAGADVTHVDSVKPVVSWARENMEVSKLDGVRWIVDDALKFVQREVRRGKKYNGIILDPPAYGRGAEARNGYWKKISTS